MKKKSSYLLLNARWLLIEELYAKCFRKFLVLHSQKRKSSKNVHLVPNFVVSWERKSYF